MCNLGLGEVGVRRLGSGKDSSVSLCVGLDWVKIQVCLCVKAWIG